MQFLRSSLASAQLRQIPTGMAALAMEASAKVALVMEALAMVALEAISGVIIMASDPPQKKKLLI